MMRAILFVAFSIAATGSRLRVSTDRDVSAHSHSAHRAHAHHRSAHRASASAHMAMRTLVKRSLLHEVAHSDAELAKAATALGHAVRVLEEVANATAVHNAKGNASETKAKPQLMKVSQKANLEKEKKVLEGLFTHLKSNIADFNKNEKKGKSDNTAMLTSLKKRLAADQEKLKSKSLSQFQHEALLNRTRMEQKEIQYWSTGREIQHNMFHAHLKMTHGLMERVKSVLDAYNDMLTKGKLDAKTKEAIKMASESLPKAFIEMRRELKLSNKLMKMKKLLPH
eukprot:gnl/TRDRNA2_/TRDRNA2_39792_c0_seq1.p2 gnl/TRDRNA2_/TRDRNA2_39792_c0~~gnl/TRDRNA2_/TRDRNA2_39792_c0_seq1.p2  ORF type:complete len:282 (-),score=75.10 gnl/TRDRNA2_/TRDRNA2_39792_c0_seq1:18-863(-)